MTQNIQVETFGNLRNFPVAEITSARAIQAADCAFAQIQAMKQGNEGRNWPTIKNRIAAAEAALADFVARYDHLLAADKSFAGDDKFPF